MNLFKKVIASVALTTLMLSMITTGVSAASTDLTAANKLAADGIINDNSANPANYNLGDKVLRQEIAKVAANVAGLTPNATCSNKFSDVSATTPNTWACGYVEALLDAGLVSANPKFNPEANISKAEALKMMLEAAGYTNVYTDAANWQAETVAFAVEKGVTTSFSDYNTEANRGWIFSVASDARDSMNSGTDLLGALLGDLGDTTTTPAPTTTPTTPAPTTPTTPTVSAAADVTVSLNPDSLADGSQVPSNGVVRFAKVDFTAGSEDATLNTVKISKTTLASIPTGTRVWFEINGKRISGKAAFSSDNTAIVSFSPSYVVMAGETATLDLYVQLVSTSGNDFQFVGELTDASVAVNGNFTTPLLTTANYTVAPIVFTKLGSTTTYTDLSVDLELGKFTLKNADSQPDIRDVEVKSITLRQLGNASLSNLSDVYLERNGTKVSTSSVVDGKYLTFILNNDVIKDGTTATYYVRGMVSNVDIATGDTYNFELKKDTDLNIVESLNGFRSSVYTDATLATVVNNVALSTYTVQGSDIRFSRDSNIELSKNVAKGTTNVTLMKGIITSTTAITLEDPSLTYTMGTASGAASLFNTVYLKIGSSVMTWTPTQTGVTTGTANFLGLVTLPAGDNVVEVYADLKDTATTTNFKFADLKLSSFAVAEYASNQNAIQTSVGTISGVDVAIDNTALTANRVDGLGNTTLAAGSKGVLLNKLSLKVNTGNDVSISNAAYTVEYTGNALNNVDLTLYADDVAISTKSFNTATVAPVAPVTAVAQVDTNTIGGTATAGDTVTSTIGGTAFTYTVVAGDTTSTIATGLAALINANAAYTATATASVITITAAVPGVSFTDVTSVSAGATVTNTAANVTANVPASAGSNGTGSVVFSGLNKIVGLNTPVTLTVKADLTDAYSAGTLSVKLSNLDITDTLTSNVVALPTISTSAIFTVATAQGKLLASTTDNTSQLLLAGTKDVRILPFKINAKNDNVKIRDLEFTGNGLDKLSNFRILDVNNNVIATSTFNAANSVKFNNLNVTDIITKDAIKTYYLVADVNLNTTLATLNATLDQANSKIKSSNGTIYAMTTTTPIVSPNHRIEENVVTVSKQVSSKSLATSALKFAVNDSGIGQATINSANITINTATYTGNGTVTIYDDATSTIVGTAPITIAANVGTATVNFNNNNTLTDTNNPTYRVTIVGLTPVASVTESWTVELSELNVDLNNTAGVNISPYTNALKVSDITETK